MEFFKVKLTPYEGRQYNDCSSIQMSILRSFIIGDVQAWPLSYIEWIFSDYESIAGNTVALDKEGEYIILTDMYSQEETPTELKVKQRELIYLLREWDEKVCKAQPDEVIVMYEDEKFFIATRND